MTAGPQPGHPPCPSLLSSKGPFFNPTPACLFPCGDNGQLDQRRWASHIGLGVGLDRVIQALWAPGGIGPEAWVDSSVNGQEEQQGGVTVCGTADRHSGSQAPSLVAAGKSCCVSHRNPSCCTRPPSVMWKRTGPCYEAWCALGPFSAALGFSEGPGPRDLSFVSTSQPERGATGWLRTAGHSRVGDKLASRPQPRVGGGGGGGTVHVWRREEQSALHCVGLGTVLGHLGFGVHSLRLVSQLPAPPAGPSPGLQCAISFQAFFPSTPRVLIVR